MEFCQFDQAAIVSEENFETDQKIWDVVVVGAGVAGASFAAVQGKRGRRVLLLERDLSQPNRIVGELLQPGGYLKLKQIGLEAATEGIDAQKVFGYGIFKESRNVKIPYESAEIEGEISGRSFHHGRFVQRLRQLAAAEKGVTIRQGTVKSLVNAAGCDFAEGETVCGVRYRCGEIDRVAKAHLTIVCDGMYSTLRKNLLEPSIKSPSHFVGVVLTDRQLPFPNHGHVVLAKPAPVLFYPIGSHEARCLVDVPGGKLPNQGSGELAQYLLTVVANEIPLSLRTAFVEAVKKGDIRSVQNKQMAAQPVQHPGAIIFGDAYNMRHPITGGGMTVALSDCQVLCDMLDTYESFADAHKVTQTVSQFHLERKPLSCTINTLANALYKVFLSTGNEAHEEMRQACFDYLSLGGNCSSGPVSLLAGLNPRPTVLVQHFFQVALYGVFHALWPFSLKKLLISPYLLADACGILFPIVRDEGWNMLWSQILPKKRTSASMMT